MSGVSFKIRYNGSVSRFRLPDKPSWIPFLDVLQKQIFSNDESFHKELLLEYIDTHGNTHTIKNEEDWNNALEELSEQSLLKFEVKEGSGFYFKDAEAPTVVKFYSTTPIIFKTQLQYNDDDRWYPFSQLEVSHDFKSIKLGTNLISDKTQNNLQISWTLENNPCSAELYFTPDNKEFAGTIQYPNQSAALFRGNEIPGDVDEERKEDISIAAPKCLEVFFPEGKILPNHLPECLRGAVAVKHLNDRDIDLDIDIKKLYQVTHNRGIDLLNEKRFEEAEKFLKNAEQLFPTSSVVHYNLGCCYALQEQPEKAIQCLEKAVHLGYRKSDAMKQDPDLASLLHTPEFWNLVDIMEGSD